jgi:hypothetical protein
MLTQFILQACGFATINRGDWISINALVVLLAVMVAALVFALANFLPTEKRERLRGAARYEILEAIISLIIIFILIAFCAFSCNAGAAVLGYSGYTDVFSSAGAYIGGLLFTNGLSLTSNFYTVSIQYEVISGLYNIAGTNLLAGANAALEAVHPFDNVEIELGLPATGSIFFSTISGLYTASYGAMLDASFSGLFILFLLLQIVEAGALTIVAPVAILLRSLSFMGPQFRRTSNLFLAMAIGFYFVFPLMLVSNMYVASCLNINTGVANPPACSYPYFSAYTQGYTLPKMSASLFTSSTQYPISSSALPSYASGGLSLPASFYGPAFAGSGQFVTEMINGPSVAMQYGSEVAGYLFLAIVMVALDLGVTAAFIMGISKGLDSIGNVFGGGPFFGG